MRSLGDAYWQAGDPDRPGGGRHVTVIGAGLVGLASAAALLRDGWRVQVVDAADAVGQGASGGNGCQLSYGYVAPLAQPQIVRQLPKLLFSAASPLRLRPRLDPAQWQWLLGFLAACRTGVAQRSTRTLLALGRLSRSETDLWLAGADAAALSFAQPGKLVLLESRQSLEQARRQVQWQAGHGPTQRMVSTAECIALEPALATLAKGMAGAVHTPTECVVDSLALCHDLERRLRARGVQFDLGLRVEGLAGDSSRVRALVTSQGIRPVEHLVIAGGTGSVALAQDLGAGLPLYPLKGYSVTLRVRTPERAPQVSVTDSRRKVVYARIGERLRVAGFVELGADAGSVSSHRIRQLLEYARDAFGEGLDFEDDVRPWAGLRPATPTSLPIIAPVPGVSNAFFNLGQGALGLTLAFGCARELAQAMASRQTT